MLPRGTLPISRGGSMEPQAATSTDLKHLGERFHALGANVLPIQREVDPAKHQADKQSGKRPLGKWKLWKTKRQTLDDVKRMTWDGYMRRDGSCVDVRALGVVDGVNGWRDLEFDRCSSIETLQRALDLLELPRDYKWAIRTGHGWRIMVLCDDDLPAGALPVKVDGDGNPESGVFSAPSRDGSFDHAEYRQRDHQSIIFGEHRDGGHYEPLFGIPTEAPAKVPVERIIATVRALCILRDRASGSTITSKAASGSTKTRRVPAASTADITTFCDLLSQLVPSFDRTRNEQHVLCPFHPDAETPSLHITLDLPGGPAFYCFSPGCPAHGGGRYGTLRMLAKKHFGLLVRDATADLGHDLGPLPWDLSRDDWLACSECSEWWHGLRRDRRPEYHHRLCHERDCIVSQKIRAGDLLWRVPGWADIYSGTVAEKRDASGIIVASVDQAWRRLREHVKALGGDLGRIPLVDGKILAFCNVQVDGLTLQSDRMAFYVMATAAVVDSPDGKRCRMIQAATVTKNKTIAAEEKHDDQVETYLPLPGGLKPSDFWLTVPPDREQDLQDIWAACGADVIRGKRGFTVRDPLDDLQLIELAEQLAVFRRKLAVEWASSISAHMQTHQYIAPIDDRHRADAGGPDQGRGARATGPGGATDHEQAEKQKATATKG